LTLTADISEVIFSESKLVDTSNIEKETSTDLMYENLKNQTLEQKVEKFSVR